METLLNTDFFIQIKTENNTNIQYAYNDFIRYLFSFCKSSGDSMLSYFILNYTRIEFVFTQNKIAECKSGKK